MTSVEENKAIIRNPERVVRILKRVCQASLPLVMRTSSQTSISIKARAQALYSSQSIPRAMRLGGISQKGMACIRDVDALQIEFIMMSTKVLFNASILGREKDSILVAIPDMLTSMERRKNARFQCSPQMMAYISLSIWMPERHDWSAPPVFPHHGHLQTRMQILDVSLNGFAAMTRFPSVNHVLKKGLMDQGAFLYLPMEAPIKIGVEVRWIKKIKEYSQDSGGREGSGDNRYLRFYKFGVQFFDETEEQTLKIRQFIQMLNQADAI